ncbi:MULTISPECIES: primosomal protein N' [Legionella]|uniref:Replication restart protein PriA n=1 Tax=Legionella septentrionalis TaxID=2498109 RepID=A0A433JK36_9GAMM|nr:primosomal protein N' [Legionella septentrionalis]MCP0914868.1 primosomal protein N' [Legionella sp. 27cVA30]RUQ88818.1 primosomal protein N' [Legionella septentrionalis]RUR02931.1 primosomal protein N' [Legionella septentrionalis]RUR11530.1 primosomal protein N' [Legionella septentrionalis]RUR16795.1 primosomal protein N' [Legionella septentrionalis]
MGIVLKICLPHTRRDFFDYYANDVVPAIGTRVWVPFRKQTRLGIVVGTGAPENLAANIKTIHSVIDAEPLLSRDILALCSWVSRYYQSPLSEVLPLALPKKYREGHDAVVPVYHCYSLKLTKEQAHARLPQRAHRQHALVDYFAENTVPKSKKDLLAAGFTASQLNSLSRHGILSIREQEPATAPNGMPPMLNTEQAHAVAIISSNLHIYRSFLLQGVTGSGKTEVYLQIIAQVLAMGRQALVLVPEIGLTPQLVARFRARFTSPMAVLHSNLSDTERQIGWQLAKTGEARIVIGTRTAIFTPLPDLGLIIIDEEHDPSLKQMDGVRYSARDTAQWRACQGNIPIILGSATPSLESLHNCQINKYILLQLTQKALTNQPLHYRILDLRNQALQHGLAQPALQLIAEHLQQQNQVLVFINRRGFAPVLLCHQCGWMADCRACDSHMTVHRKSNRLICHHCGLLQAIPTHCAQCSATELLPIGAGTQRIHEFLATQFPTTRILRIDRDEVSGKEALATGLQQIEQGEVQLIVGTQMLAKGHHFPRLTLVVIVDADHGFYNQDFRALERLGQLLIQVAGRAGRAHLPGQVLIQTHLPQHPLLNLLIQEGYQSFAHALLQQRQEAQLPPYHFLAVIRAQGKIQEQVVQFLSTLQQFLHQDNLATLGPAPAPLARKANQHRLQLLIKSASRKKLQSALTALQKRLTANEFGGGIRWNIDVDPIDLS